MNNSRLALADWLRGCGASLRGCGTITERSEVQLKIAVPIGVNEPIRRRDKHAPGVPEMGKRTSNF